MTEEVGAGVFDIVADVVVVADVVFVVDAVPV